MKRTLLAAVAAILTLAVGIGIFHIRFKNIHFKGAYLRNCKVAQRH